MDLFGISAAPDIPHDHGGVSGKPVHNSIADLFCRDGVPSITEIIYKREGRKHVIENNGRGRMQEESCVCGIFLPDFGHNLQVNDNLKNPIDTLGNR